MKSVPKTTRTTFNPGRTLQEVRRKKHLTRRDVANRLKLSISAIKYIDLWQIEKLPSELRAKPIVRDYAKLLGLNPVRFEESVPNEKTKKYTGRRLWVVSHATSWLIALLVILLAVGFIGWRTFIATALPRLEVSFPPDNYQTTSRSITLKGVTSEGAQVLVNGIDVLVEPDGSFTSLVILHSGSNKIDVKAINSYGRTSKLSRQVIGSQAN